MAILYALFALGLAFAALLLRRASRADSVVGNEPPGPPGLPIVGNRISTIRVWKTLANIGRPYGPLYSLRIFGTKLLVVNSADTAHELFELRSAKYANRPLPKMIEMSGFDRGVALEHDPNLCRQGRKVIHSVFQPRELEKHTVTINKHLARYLRSLLQSPESYLAHTRLFTAAIMLEMSHGYEAVDNDDPIIREANVLVANFASASNPGGHLVDWLPFLSVLPEWLPFMDFKRTARRWREQYDAIATKAHEYVEEEIAHGTARPSMTSKMLLEDSEKVSREVIMYSAAQTYTGGADTSASTIAAFMLMMVRHPDVQAKGQAEVDGLVGFDPFRAEQERDRLRYVDAIFAEVLRVLPPIPAITREPSEDDIYNGLFIQKGTKMIENIWRVPPPDFCLMAMLHDEDVYPEPFLFKPERWAKVSKLEFDKHPMNVAFGFGRRVCPGRLLAEKLSFLAIASILSLFHISPAYDDAGNPIIPECEQTDGSIIFPLPFRCTIRPRTDECKKRIEELVAAFE
ncbi:cytochrome P450 [Earliella scabrosa]|nr:cytochrome P450 [Earliella scabrosa]